MESSQDKPQQSPLVSVVLPIFNEEISWVRIALESILNQSHTNIEVIAALDNPARNDILILLNEIREKDNRIKILRNEQNLGLVANLNKALSICTGSYIARMDADDISTPVRLEVQLKYILDHKLDLVGSSINLVAQDGSFIKYKHKQERHEAIVDLLKNGIMGIVHPTFLFNQNLLSKMNGYEFCQHAEDMEFLARAISHGFKVGNVQAPLLSVRHHPRSITKSNTSNMIRNAKSVQNAFSNYLRCGIYTPPNPTQHSGSRPFGSKRLVAAKWLLHIGELNSSRGDRIRSFVFYALAILIGPEMLRSVRLRLIELLISRKYR